MLNLRGNDIEFNPLFFSYLLFHKEEEGSHRADLFINWDKVTDVQQHINSNNITVHAYEPSVTCSRLFQNRR